MSVMRNHDAWAKSLRNFDWLKDATSGGMDIDLLIERNRSFMVIEGKPWQKDGVRVPYGQHKALYHLSLQPNTRVYLVGEDAGDQLHVFLYNGASAPVYCRGDRTSWFKAERFIPTTRDEFAKMVNAWWRDAETRQAA